MIKGGALLAVAGLLAAACSSGRPGPVVTVTRTRTPTHAASTHSSSPGQSPAPTHQSRLNGTCETLLTPYDVRHAVGDPLTGPTAFVVGTAERTIGRLAYLNCRYGLPARGTGGVPKVEVGISLYATPARAAARIPATVDDYTAHGATATGTTVAGHRATILVGGIGDGYAVPLLVVASGQRTVAVSIGPALGSGPRARTAATALAALALARTGG